MQRNRDPSLFRRHSLCQFLQRGPNYPPAACRAAKISVETYSVFGTRWFIGRSRPLEAQVHFVEAGDLLCILLLYEWLQW
jgi:hypothetical protein